MVGTCGKNSTMYLDMYTSIQEIKSFQRKSSFLPPRFMDLKSQQVHTCSNSETLKKSQLVHSASDNFKAKKVKFMTNTKGQLELKLSSLNRMKLHAKKQNSKALNETILINRQQ
ncbi:hypothetical protein ABFS83_06G038600 [Erythranthe nasuta]